MSKLRDTFSPEHELVRISCPEEYRIIAVLQHIRSDIRRVRPLFYCHGRVWPVPPVAQVSRFTAVFSEFFGNRLTSRGRRFPFFINDAHLCPWCHIRVVKE